MHHAPYMYQLFLTHQMLSAGILGHSPVAQGFFQSYQPQMSASYPYSTPLGPLSPFAAVSGSLPVRYQHSLLTPSHTHIVTSPLPHILTLSHLHSLTYSHCYLRFSLLTLTLPPLHPLTHHTHILTQPPLHSFTHSHCNFSTPSPQSSGPGPLQHVQTVGPGIGFTSTSSLPQSTGTPSPFHYGPASQRYTMAQVVTHTSQNRAPGSPTKPSPMVRA